MEPPTEKRMKINPIEEDSRRLAPLTAPTFSKAELLEHYK